MYFILKSVCPTNTQEIAEIVVIENHQTRTITYAIRERRM